MTITDELRKWAKGSDGVMCGAYQALLAIADRIDAAVEGMVALPKDADGEPIHAGDVLDGYGKTIEVVELRHGRSGWVLISRDGNGYADTFAFTHHKPTVEDVLREFADAILEWAGKSGTVAEVGTWSDVAAEYAAKLRLAEGEDA